MFKEANHMQRKKYKECSLWCIALPLTRSLQNTMQDSSY